MAAKIAKMDAGEVKRGGDVFLFDPFEVEPCEDTGRHFPPTESEIDAMAASILANGQITPVSVRRMPGTNKIRMVAGSTRYEACRKLRQSNPEQKLRATLDTNLNEQDAFIVTLIENLHRKDTNLVDAAYNIHKLTTQYAWDSKKIAALYKWDEGKVRKVHKLKSLPERVQRMVSEKRLALDAALMFVDQDEETINAILDMNGVGAAVVEMDPDGNEIQKTLLPAVVAPRPKSAAPKADVPEVDPEPEIKFDPMTGAPITPKKKRGRKKHESAKLPKSAIKNALRSMGGTAKRTLSDLRSMLDGRSDRVSTAILGYLEGTIDPEMLSKVLDAAEEKILADDAEYGETLVVESSR